MYRPLDSYCGFSLLFNPRPWTDGCAVADLLDLRGPQRVSEYVCDVVCVSLFCPSAGGVVGCVPCRNHWKLLFFFFVLFFLGTAITDFRITVVAHGDKMHPEMYRRLSSRRLYKTRRVWYDGSNGLALSAVFERHTYKGLFCAIGL